MNIIYNKFLIWPLIFAFFVTCILLSNILKRRIRKDFENNGIVATADILGWRIDTISDIGMLWVYIDVSFTGADNQTVIIAKRVYVHQSDMADAYQKKQIKIKYLRKDPINIIVLDDRFQCIFTMRS